MNKTQSLILLINTLSKAEKKAISLQASQISGKKLYLDLYRLINDKKIENTVELQKEYSKLHSEASFHTEVAYLYDFILGILTKLKINQDKGFALYRKLLNAQILRDRNLNTDYYNALLQLEKDAEEISSYYILLVVRRMQLDFLRTNNFLDISSRELQKKQHKVDDTLKIIRQINDQSKLFELLLYRIEKSSKSKKQKDTQNFDDLVMSEISLISGMNKDVFEVQKLHQLFQAHYLSSIGNYKSALTSFVELNKLFENNEILWNNPPVYYVNVLEGILKSLSENRMYEQMPYFFDKLSGLSESYSSIPFQKDVEAIIAIYSIILSLNTEDPANSLTLLNEYKISLLDKSDLLTPYRYLQIAIYVSVVYLTNKQYNKAKRVLSKIINNDTYLSFTLFRVAQLLNLVACYELKDTDFVNSQILSIKRYNKINKRTSKFENILFRFLNTDILVMSKIKKEAFRKKMDTDLKQIKLDGEAFNIFFIFDFEEWILSHF